MPNDQALTELMNKLQQWSQEFGFSDFGVSAIDLEDEREALEAWLKKKRHAGMQWLEENHEKRLRPELLVPGTLRVISVRMNYLSASADQVALLKSPSKAYISRYALGRDYHKLLRKRLAKLGQKVEQLAEELDIHSAAQTRAFVDSAPVLERPLAKHAGIGWVGKHTLILNKHAGSWFFLGELYTNLPLPIENETAENACGECEACIKICPTDAFPRPYELDASRCISYLTIEHKGSIPLEFREAIGNRIFGCDDCQIICPWNKYAQLSQEDDFRVRHQLDAMELLALFSWTENEFLKKTEGSAIRRTGYSNWRRNIAVALGNAPKDLRIVEALKAAKTSADAMLTEHLDWALERQMSNTRRKRKLRNPEKTDKN